MRIPHHLRSEMSFNLKPLTHAWDVLGGLGCLKVVHWVGRWVDGGLFWVDYGLEYCVSIYQ